MKGPHLKGLQHWAWEPSGNDLSIPPGEEDLGDSHLSHMETLDDVLCLPKQDFSAGATPQ